MKKNTVSFILYCHLPFVRETSPRFVYEELPFFESISLTFLPFLQMLDRLEAQRIPFHIALVLPPLLCHLLTDEILVNRYLEYVDNQIAFGAREVERLRDNPEMLKLAQHYYDRAIDKRVLFTERYNKNIPEALSYYAQRGKLEFITSAAANAYLPFYVNYPSSINAQIETALVAHRNFFKTRSQGFWLPELAYYDGIDTILNSYKFGWTVIDTHSALLSRPSPETGSFYPLKTPNGLFLLVKDFYAYDDIMSKKNGLPTHKSFRSFFDDVGFDLPQDYVNNFITGNGIRLATGYKYFAKGENAASKTVYNMDSGREAAKDAATRFMENRRTALAQASALIQKNAVSFCVFPMDFFGRFWYEGWVFMEEIFRQNAQDSDIQILTPSEYLYKENASQFPVVIPEYSSNGHNGYAETFLDATNDWVYRHILRSVERMVALAERFGEESGIRERVLNQAAREILLATETEWARLISNSETRIPGEWQNYARNRLEAHLRNFTTLYESLGSAQLSTRFLTDLETRNNVFPDINYRSFRRKKKIEFPLEK